MITYDALAALPNGDPGPWGDAVEITYDQRDVLLYAVGVGVQDLRYIYEGHADFSVFPTFPIRWGSAGAPIDESLIPRSPLPLMIDAERYLSVERPLPLAGTVSVQSRVVGIHPRGKGNGFVECESTVTDADGNVCIRMANGSFRRGVNQLGDIEPFTGSGKTYSTKIELPDSPPDVTAETAIAKNQAHIYRLSGDYNPLHIEPEAAKFGGFDEPILHGLCTFGHCADLLLGAFCDGDSSRFRKIKVRFSAPVYPGDTLQLRAWHDGDGRALFEMRVKDTVVISNAYFEFSSSEPGVTIISSHSDSSEDAIKALMNTYADAMTKQDGDVLRALMSNDWQGSKGITAEQFVGYYIGSGDKQIDLSLAKLKFDGDLATFSPVTILSSKGSITHRHSLKKDPDDGWKICQTKTIDWESIPMTAEEKERKHEIDESAMAARASREKMLSDPARPGYHFVSPEGVALPFDPNGCIYWKGRYHMFYIFQDTRSGEKMDHWGHVSSTDLFHWRHHPTHLLDGMYSGNCFINADGVPTICYHQVDQGNAMAIAVDDDLNEWQKLDSNPITPNTKEGDEHHGKYRSWDPFAWLEGDTYYAIFGGERPAIAKAPALSGEWKYVGDLFAHGIEGVSLDEDVSCAELFKLGNKDVLLCISHRLGCRYYLGEWKNEQFYPDFHAQMSWVDNVFFAPESLLDDKGRRIMWAWLQDFRELGVRWETGWSGTMSLPRVLSLSEEGEMLMDVPEEIEALRYDARSHSNLEVQADIDQVVKDVSGNSLEIYIELESSEASEYGVRVCVSPDGKEQTVIAYNAEEGLLKLDVRNAGPGEWPNNVEAAPFRLKHGERLQLRVFIDASVVEVFANRRQAVARRIYPAQSDSLGVSLFSTGGAMQVHTLKSWKMSPSNPY